MKVLRIIFKTLRKIVTCKIPRKIILCAYWNEAHAKGKTYSQREIVAHEKKNNEKSIGKIRK